MLSIFAESGDVRVQALAGCEPDDLRQYTKLLALVPFSILRTGKQQMLSTTSFGSVFCSACFAVAASTMLIGSLGQLNAGTITIIDVPGATYTGPNSISGNNVVGSYRDGSNKTHGFLFDGSSYTTIDFPGSKYTYLTGVSGKNVVGWYIDMVNSNAHGFLFDGSTYINIVYPGESSSMAIAVSGNSVVGNNGFGAFLFDGSAYNAISPPNASRTEVTGVSGKNVVGRYVDNFVHFGHSFLFDGSTYTNFGHIDGEKVNGVSGKNVVGDYKYPPQGIDSGFLWDGNNYRFIFPPGAKSSTATGVSGNNVVGQYVDFLSSQTHGYFFDGATYTTIDLPGAASISPTAVSGINVVGFYLDASGQTHGFLYAPEPSTLALAAFGAIGLLIAARRKR